jgi:hypothetical protein
MPPALTISKAEGAHRQVEEAIKAMKRGDFDVAVTLAGAAEGMFELRSGLWEFMLHSPNAAALAEAMEVERQELIGYLNDLRDWLKHGRTSAGQTRTITTAHAAVMIAGAMSKLEKWSPAMTKFKGWYEKSVMTESFWEELQCTPPSSG